ncbi:MAG: hypothetical protein H7A01_07080 [Hahellaceae bacterium]|nr:hypothetical protein [Hahellaceae bacterium]MCP5211722.1 hypothetical protein [Hahellaceae bacterium]
MKNNKIVLWGASRFAQKFIPLVQASGIEIRYCIDSYHYGFKINDVEVISSSDPRVHDLLTTPVVITAHSENGLSAWEKVFNMLYNNEAFNNARLLHPSALFERLQIDLSNNLFLNAIGRSGNLVSSTLINKLRAQSPINKSEPSYEMFLIAASDAMSIWEGHFRRLFQYMDVSHYNCTMDSLNTLRISGLKNNSQVLVQNIPCLYPFKGPVLSVSISPKSINTQFLTKNGCICLMPTRHPLDILISQAFYLNKTLSDIGLVKDIGGENTARNSIAYSRLTDRSWVESTLNLIVEFMYTQISEDPSPYPIRYESLMNSPEETLTKLANQCQLALSSKTLMETWQSIQNKPLNQEHKAHFNSPGTNKWMKYFPAEFADMLASEQLVAVCERLNYELDVTKLLSHSEMFKFINQETITLYKEWQNHLTTKCSTVSVNEYRITGPSEFTDFLSIALSSKYFERLSQAFHLGQRS